MSIEDNKQLIRTYIAAVNRGQAPEILALLADDFTFRGMGRKPEAMKYVWNREQFAGAPAAMSSQMKKPIQLNIVSMIGEGDDVAVEANTNGELKNGKIYDNAYHFVFAIKDGKIREVREYCCTYLAAYTFMDLAEEGVKV